MDYVNEITSYFLNLINELDAEHPETKHTIDNLPTEDQLIYYKLCSLLNGTEVFLEYDDIIKIDCIKLLCDYRHKGKLRSIDIIIAGDYPKLLGKYLFNENFVDLEKYYKIAKQYHRNDSAQLIKRIYNNMNSINNEKNELTSYQILEKVYALIK